ncbi:helix-turn-helix domain-containing protein [Micromonospora sp. HNM0581]|uniref:IclR family transcriptional regulator n=1 Tax=Micromonospora sp. HNM0581 TaxID=2716341 RepID=UPI001469EA87|nr:helix-turn-helix domain-containing protein [Micromonospora sp. HNM0581]NLU79214.1 helix-turn-helix domain-containing protein [Micromonospora sp. HNM0581]
MTTGGAPRVKSADRTVELLELLAAMPDRRTLVELARDLGIPKSSMHGLLRTLVQRGWVETDSGGSRYGLGVQALRTGAAYLRTDRAVRRLTSVVDWLHRELDTSVQLGRLVGGHMVCLLTREKADVRPMLRAGWPSPAYTTAIGRVVLARATSDDVSLTRMLPASAALTPSALDALQHDLARTVERGHAVDMRPTGPEHGTGVAVAAPPTLGPYDAVGVCAAPDALTESRASEIAATVRAAITAGLAGRL